MIYVGFPAEPEGIEARRTDFNRYFRQLDNPEYNRRCRIKFWILGFRFYLFTAKTAHLCPENAGLDYPAFHINMPLC